jgi:hypothetical protein
MCSAVGITLEAGPGKRGTHGPVGAAENEVTWYMSVKD